jgi:hypothetical protein
MSARQLTALILPNVRALRVGNGQATVKLQGRVPECSVVDVGKTFFLFARSEARELSLGNPVESWAQSERL